MQISFYKAGLIWLFTSCLATQLLAAELPFVESFSDGFANWADSSQSFGLDYISTGGPDGNGYVSDTVSFANSADDDSFPIFRAHDLFDASGDAFVGNWIDEGVGQFSAMVRHTMPIPINFFTRFSSSNNFPGAVAVAFVPVVPNVWTELSFSIAESDPQFVTFEGSSFADVFSNIGNLQVGANVPVGFGGNTTDYTFDLDVVGITAVPEPALAWIGLAGFALLCQWARPTHR